MRCEEARRRLRFGLDEQAEAHLASCPTCFEALELDDELVLALREARPEPVVAPAWLVARVISRWELRRRLPWYVGGLVVLAASVAAASAIWLLAGSYGEPLLIGQSVLGSLLRPLVEGLVTLGEIFRSKLLDNPTWIGVLVVLAAASGAGFAALYRQAAPGPRRLAW